jgi:hypothetical protein
MPEMPRNLREYLRGPARAAIVVTILILVCWFIVLLHSTSQGVPNAALPPAWIVLFLVLCSTLFAASEWPHRVGLLGVVAAGVIFFNELIRPQGSAALRTGFWPITIGLAVIWIANRLRGGKWLTPALLTGCFLGAGFVCMMMGKGVSRGGAGLFASHCASVISHGLDLANNDVFLQALGALAVVGWLAGQNAAGTPAGPGPPGRGQCVALSAAAALFLYTNFQPLIFAFLIGALALYALITGRRLTAMLIAAFGGAMMFHAALGLADESGVSPGYEILLIAAFVTAVSEKPPICSAPQAEPSC